MIAVYDTTHQTTVDVGAAHELLHGEVLPALAARRAELPEAAFEVGDLLARARAGRAYLWHYRETGTGDFWLWVRDVAGYPRDAAAACLEVAPHTSGNGQDRALAAQLGAQGLEKLRWLVRLPDLWERTGTKGTAGTAGTVEREGQGLQSAICNLQSAILVEVGVSQETGAVLEQAVADCSLAEVANWVRGIVGDKNVRDGRDGKDLVFTQSQVARARARLEAIRPVVDGHESVGACALRLGRSYGAVKGWVERFAAGGSRWEALVDAAKSGRPSAISELDARALLQLCEALPALSTDEAILRLRDQSRWPMMPGIDLSWYSGWQSDCSRGAAQRLRKQHRLSRKKVRRVAPVERFEAQWAGELLQIDIMDHLKIKELVPFTYKGKAYLVTGIDDKSRRIPFGMFCAGDETERVLPVVYEMARRAGGGWRKILCDQGSQFVLSLDTNARPVLNPAFERVCAECGSGVIPAAAYRAQTKGKQEKWYQLAQGRGIYGYHLEQLDEWNDWFGGRFIPAYNNTPHSALPVVENAPALLGETLCGILPRPGGRRHLTPDEAWAQFLIPGGLHVLNPETDPERLCAMEVNDGRVGDAELCVRWKTNQYSIPPEHVGEGLRVFYSVSRVWLYTARLDLVAEHVRLPDGAGERSQLPMHPTPRDLRLEGKGLKDAQEGRDDRDESKSIALELRERLPGGGVRRRAVRAKKGTRVDLAEDLTPKIERLRAELGRSRDPVTAWLDVCASERTKGGRMTAGTLHSYLEELVTSWLACRDRGEQDAFLKAVQWVTQKRITKTTSLRTMWNKLREESAAAEASQSDRRAGRSHFEERALELPKRYDGLVEAGRPEGPPGPQGQQRPPGAGGYDRLLELA
jgi:hypothetical protein